MLLNKFYFFLILVKSKLSFIDDKLFKITGIRIAVDKYS